MIRLIDVKDELRILQDVHPESQGQTEEAETHG